MVNISSEILKTLPVSGGSMLPLIHQGDRIFFLSCQPDTIKMGDILVFAYGGKTVVHRVVRIKFVKKKIQILQKGDASPVFFWMEPDHVLGKVIGIQTERGYIPLQSATACFLNRLSGFLGLVWTYFQPRPDSVRDGPESGPQPVKLVGIKRGLFIILKGMVWTVSQAIIIIGGKRASPI